MDHEVIVLPKGTTVWYNSDKRLHRVDGPAIVSSSGNRYWYLNGTRLSFDEWCDQVGIDEKTRTFLRIKYA